MRYTIGWTVFGLVVIFGIGWVVRANFFAQEKVFAPQEEALRRETFEQSKAYNQGLAQEIQGMQFEYVKATPDQRAAMRSIILHRVADYDVSRFPADTRKFIESLNGGAP
jgi:hypothetical protein